MLKLKTCEVMQYFDYLDTDNVDVIVERIKGLTNIKTFAFIVHDKDIREDGELKSKHFHCVLTFKDTTTSSVIANALHIEEQFVNKIKTTTKSAELYLIHKNNPEKYQYNPNNVISNFDYVEKYDGVEPMQRREEIAKKIDSGTIKAYNLSDYIGVNEYAKNKVYFDRCFEFRQNKLKGCDREMECVFITGASGTGKTTFAKNMAAQKGYACYISSGGKNPLDNYRGEECIILDDLRDSSYKLSDFLKLTDNNTDSLVGCRFYNKSIAECRLLIVTSVKSIKDFYFNATVEEQEPQKQLFRRFKTYIIMEREKMFFFGYNPDTSDYIKLQAVKNPISVLFDKEIASKFSNDLINLMGLEVFNDTVEEPQQTVITDDDLPF